MSFTRVRRLIHASAAEAAAMRTREDPRDFIDLPHSRLLSSGRGYCRAFVSAGNRDDGTLYACGLYVCVCFFFWYWKKWGNIGLLRAVSANEMYDEEQLF